MEARAFKRSAYAESTKSVYKSQLKCYVEFCMQFGCTPVPATQMTLVAYLAFLAKKLSASSIPGYLNVVRLLHLEAGLSNPLESNWELQLIKKGIRRQLGKPPLQKLPITLNMLRDMYVLIDHSCAMDVAFWSAILVGFFGFLRKSTLLPSSVSVSPGKFLARSDVLNFSLESFELQIKNSKVIQFGQRVLVLPFVRVLDVRLCPVRALLVHLGRSVLGGDRPLFNFVEGAKETFFGHAAFVAKLKNLLCCLGVDPKLYSAHSLRRGGASYAFLSGLNPLQIKSRGDWASAAFEKYVFISSEGAFVAARALAVSASN
jgi:hypothetical protein